MLELLSMMSGLIAGPFSLAVFVATVITLLKAVIAGRDSAIDTVFRVGFFWLFEAVLLGATIIAGSEGKEIMWFIGPTLPIAALLTMGSLVLLVLAGVIIRRKCYF